MNKPKIIYVYDALCGWCYGFSPIIKTIYDNYRDVLDFEILSGGMILGCHAGPVSVVAPYIKTAYKTIEEIGGVKFGEAFLQHLETGEMILNSEKPAIALSVFRSYFPDKGIDFAYDLQNSIYYDGKDPNKNEIYRYLAVNFGIDPDVFVYKMELSAFKQSAHHDFLLAKQFQITGYPAVLLQSSEDHYYLLSRGYTDIEILEQRINKIMEEISGAHKIM